jgi:hypothetical protein
MQAPGVQRQRCVRELDLTISNSPVSAPVSGTVFSSAPLPSRAASASRVLQLPFFVQPPRGVAERREAPALKQVALVGRDTTLARHGPSRATGTPPRGAPPWRCRPRVRPVSGIAGYGAKAPRRRALVCPARPRASRIRGYEPRSTPHPAPPSGSSPEDAPRQAGSMPCILNAICSQQLSSSCDEKCTWLPQRICLSWNMFSFGIMAITNLDAFEFPPAFVHGAT